MNIWYVHPYLGVPDNAEYGRGFFLGSALQKMGVNFRVITASHHHLIKSDYDQKNNIYSSTVDSVPFTWIKSSRYSENSIKRIVSMLTFGVRFRFVDLVHNHQHEKPDVIILSSAHPFHLSGGIHWANKYDAKLIYEVRDLWPLSLNQLLGMSEYHPFSLLLGMLEQKAYKVADQVVSLLPNALSHMLGKGLNPVKFNYVPNGTRIGQTKENVLSGHGQYLEALKKKGAFIFMYAGAHGVPNALEPLLEAANRINKQKDKKIEFVFVGEGVCKEKLIESAKSENIDNVHFLDAVPRNEVPDTLSYADMVFIGGKNMPLYDFGVSPNKMFEYMLASLPILMTISSPNNPLELAGSGSCLGSNDPVKIADEIIRYSEMPAEELRAIGKKGKEYVEKHHLYDTLAQQYMSVIEKIY